MTVYNTSNRPVSQEGRPLKSPKLLTNGFDFLPLKFLNISFIGRFFSIYPPIIFYLIVIMNSVNGDPQVICSRQNADHKKKTNKHVWTARLYSLCDMNLIRFLRLSQQVQEEHQDDLSLPSARGKKTEHLRCTYVYVVYKLSSTDGLGGARGGWDHRSRLLSYMWVTTRRCWQRLPLAGEGWWRADIEQGRMNDVDGGRTRVKKWQNKTMKKYSCEILGDMWKICPRKYM